MFILRPVQNWLSLLGIILVIILGMQPICIRLQPASIKGFRADRLGSKNRIRKGSQKSELFNRGANPPSPAFTCALPACLHREITADLPGGNDQLSNFGPEFQFRMTSGCLQDVFRMTGTLYVCAQGDRSSGFLAFWHLALGTHKL